MAERRSLVEGVKPPVPTIDPKLEKSFVFGEQAREVVETTPVTTSQVTPRSPLSTRIRADYAKALKHASLDRQLKGIEPNALCDILEQALEPWLKTHGYLT